jgi:septal ring factor EnvC (AmiA/AmiB activator)
MVHHVEAVASRFAGLEERVSALDRFAQEMPGHLEAMVARLDSHTETLRNLEQRQIRRVSTLNQVLDSLARLKEPESPEMGLPAVA